MKSYEPTSFHVFAGYDYGGVDYQLSNPSLDDAKKYINDGFDNDEMGFDSINIMAELEDGQLHIVASRDGQVGEWKDK